ncbi:uracil-DNA glycosylase [Helicobacter cholecystus]|uniref:Uracil-DNA glycosylase n=1 Tax=Helicobacter cholecystus TaxID=45498 RepID=A0A3D8IY37_9HELI|nr:uracil-DNA glycosylase [Helicobacter cholecystus]
MQRIKLRDEWKKALKQEFDKPYFAHIKQCYLQAKARGEVIYPKGSLTFEALNRLAPNEVRVVILGQDPYHGSERVNAEVIPQAMGLSFSVPKPLKAPPSLKNIYKELQNTTSFIPPNHGDLSAWCERGVLLLNSVLSVQAGKAGSHAYFGWETFTDSVISYISCNLRGVVFMLWGNYAKRKAILIDATKHCIIQAPHPSPLARGFVGSGVFLQANEALKSFGYAPIDWQN